MRTRNREKLMTKTINGRTFEVYSFNNNSEVIFYVREFSKDALTGKLKLEHAGFVKDLTFIK